MSSHHKCESPAATGLNAENQNTHAECTTDQKRLANVIAQLSLAGHEVHKIESGYLVTRWGQSRVCPDLMSLVGFARQIVAAQ